MSGAPVRFLALVLGGWIGVRAAMLAPTWWGGPEDGNAPELAPRAAAPSAPAVATPAGAPARAPPAPGHASAPSYLIRQLPYKIATSGRRSVAYGSPASRSSLLLPPDSGLSEPAGLPVVAVPRPHPAEPLAPPAPARADGPWSASAWLLVRREPGGPALAAGGSLGGSQAGGRLLYTIGDGLSLSGRAYAPLRRTAGAEVAAGLDWRPAAAIPVHLLAERRQAIGREGRSAFSFSVYGGARRTLPGGLRLDGYAQAGIVGLRSRDAFVDGAARLSTPVGPVDIGVAAWGAAQPGAARLDAGPSLSYRLPIRRPIIRIGADWRLRVAGGAAPESGPALTLATDF